jgi:uncharacterized membrane protein
MTRLKRISLGLISAFYTFAGVMHFVKPEYFLAIVPPYLPAPLALVLISGAFEIILGLAILIPGYRRRAAFGIIALLFAVFPANFYMYQKAVADGGSAFEVSSDVLYWRLWVQALFVVWAYWHTRVEAFKAYPV